MLSREEVLLFLSEYCAQRGLSATRASEQLHAFGKDYAVLCVPDPDAPAPDGLQNDIETLMLPTLYVRKTRSGLEAEETEYTSRFLSGAAA